MSLFLDPVSFSTTNNLVYQGVVGGNITLICVILDFVEFQWQFSDKSVVPSNNGKYLYEGNNLTILNLSVNDAMSYLCVGNNQVTTVNKLKAQLLVYSKSKKSIIINFIVQIFIFRASYFDCKW